MVLRLPDLAPLGIVAREMGTKKQEVPKVYSRTLQKAVELAGSPRKLARELQVPVAELEKWLSGGTQPPLATFLKAIDFVLDETAPPGGLSDPPESGAPRDCADGSSLNF